MLPTPCPMTAVSGLDTTTRSRDGIMPFTPSRTLWPGFSSDHYTWTISSEDLEDLSSETKQEDMESKEKEDIKSQNRDSLEKVDLSPKDKLKGKVGAVTTENKWSSKLLRNAGSL